MQRNNRFVGLITAIIVGFLVAIGVQAFSTPQPQSTPQGKSNQQQIATISVQEVTLVPITDPTSTPLAINVGSPMPEPPDQTPIVVPTSEPLPEAPAPAGLASAAPVLFTTDFSSPDLSDWTYDQIFWDPQPAPAWKVKNDHYATEVLVAPEQREAITLMNDTMAFPPVAFTGNGSIEVQAVASSGEKIGLVLGDVESQQYVLMIVGTPNAQGIGTGGLSFVKLYGEESREILLQDPTVMIDNETWYHLKLERDDDTIYASVDGGDPISLTLPEDLPITNVGLLAGSSGYGVFDQLLVLGEEE